MPGALAELRNALSLETASYGILYAVNELGNSLPNTPAASLRRQRGFSRSGGDRWKSKLVEVMSARLPTVARGMEEGSPSTDWRGAHGREDVGLLKQSHRRGLVAPLYGCLRRESSVVRSKSAQCSSVPIVRAMCGSAPLHRSSQPGTAMRRGRRDELEKKKKGLRMKVDRIFGLAYWCFLRRTVSWPRARKTAPNQSSNRVTPIHCVRDVAANDQVAKVLAGMALQEESIRSDKRSSRTCTSSRTISTAEEMVEKQSGLDRAARSPPSGIASPTKGQSPYASH